MDFIDQIKQFSKRVDSMRATIQTEEATKTALIMPFFAMLGYDVFNPQEFVPEYTADVGIKKGEKVDYAIMQDGSPVILVECKSVNENLGKHDSQLFRYFGTSTAKFAILTNGVHYNFYTDLDSPNKMDSSPFLSVNLLDVRDNQVTELKKFSKAVFDVESIFGTASELKYAQEFKHFFTSQLDAPTDEFTKLFLQSCYSGLKTQSIVDKFRPLLKKALNESISEMMNDKIKLALGGTGGSISVSDTSAVASTQVEEPVEPPESTEKRTPNIVTTEEELEGYFIVKNMLGDMVSIKEITYKDTESYFSILYKGNTRKWICRLRITESIKSLIIPTEEKKEVKFTLTDIYDLNNYKEQLSEVLTRYI